MNWVPVVAAGTIPEGKGIAVLVPPTMLPGRKTPLLKVALFNWNGAYHAIDAECPHYGGPLQDSKILMGGVVECPLHWWRFELATGQCENFPGVRTTILPTRVVDGNIEIGIPEEGDRGSAGE